MLRGASLDRELEPRPRMQWPAIKAALKESRANTSVPQFEKEGRDRRL